MKKSLSLLVVGISLFALNGCGDNDINEIALEELQDGYSLKLSDVEGDSVTVKSSEAEAQIALPQTYIYKFCGLTKQPAEAEVEMVLSDGNYYKYTTEGVLSANGNFWIYTDRLELEGNPYTIYTDTSSFKTGSTYESDGTYDVKVDKIDAIRCEDIPEPL